MKKAILIMLAALMLVSSLTACGNKKANYDEDGYSRVLYDDSDEVSSEDEETDEEEQSEESEQTDTNEESSTDTGNESEESGKIASRASDTDSDKKKNTSSKSSSTVSTVKSTAKTSSGSNSTAASSKSSTTGGSSSKASVSSASSSETSTDTNTDTSTDSDTDSSTDTEWFDSENDSDINSDTDSEIEKGTFEVSDMSFPVNGDLISVGDSFEEADELLGGPNESYGNVYYYNECKITTNGDEEDEIITNITITSAQYPIAKDIRIGSTTDDLLRAFGDAEYGYTYTLVDRILNFVVVDDEIIEISFS